MTIDADEDAIRAAAYDYVDLRQLIRTPEGRRIVNAVWALR